MWTVAIVGPAELREQITNMLKGSGIQEAGRTEPVGLVLVVVYHLSEALRPVDHLNKHGVPVVVLHDPEQKAGAWRDARTLFQNNSVVQDALPWTRENQPGVLQSLYKILDALEGKQHDHTIVDGAQALIMR